MQDAKLYTQNAPQYEGDCEYRISSVYIFLLSRRGGRWGLNEVGCIDKCSHLWRTFPTSHSIRSVSVFLGSNRWLQVGEKKVISYQLNITVVGRGKCFNSVWTQVTPAYILGERVLVGGGHLFQILHTFNRSRALIRGNTVIVIEPFSHDLAN